MEITRANSAQQLKIKIGNPSTVIGQIVDESKASYFQCMACMRVCRYNITLLDM